MQELKNNQILIEVSEDKKKITVSLGNFPSLTFDACPNKITQNIGNAITSYFEKTGLDHLPEWQKEKCAYEDGEGCFDCN